MKHTHLSMPALAGVLALVLGGAAAAASGAGSPRATEGASVNSLYDLQVTTLDGNPADLASYRGRVTLVVNVASKCGYTPQYAGLEELYRDLSPKGFAILGFPSNDFGGQEPGTAEEIRTFCTRNYGVTFPMFSKVVTRAGADQSPVYEYLGGSGHLPQWNFSKYVIGKDGKVVAFFPSDVKPDSPELLAAIDKAMAAGR